MPVILLLLSKYTPTLNYNRLEQGIFTNYMMRVMNQRTYSNVSGKQCVCGCHKAFPAEDGCLHLNKRID